MVRLSKPPEYVNRRVSIQSEIALSEDITKNTIKSKYTKKEPTKKGVVMVCVPGGMEGYGWGKG